MVKDLFGEKFVVGCEGEVYMDWMVDWSVWQFIYFLLKEFPKIIIKSSVYGFHFHQDHGKSQNQKGKPPTVIGELADHVTNAQEVDKGKSLRHSRRTGTGPG